MKPHWSCAVLSLACMALAPVVGATPDTHDPDPTRNKPTIGRAVRFDVSKPLSQMTVPPIAAGPPRQIPIQKRDLKKRAHPAALARDPLLTRGYVPGPQGPMPEPIATFEGTSDEDNEAVAGGRIVPSDTNGDVGPDHYVQFNNLVFQVFDKTTGASLLGPLPGNSLFSGFGGPCESKNDGDTLVLYDQLSDRWVLSQFAIDDGVECVAVSTTADPTGSYYRYAFTVTPGARNDYPKMGVWPDAYYSSYRRFPVDRFAIVAAAFERDKMLAGDPGARLVTFVIPAPAGIGCPNDGTCYEGVLPTHLEGRTPPPAGTPNFFVMADDDEVNGGSPSPDFTKDFYHVWKFHVDWTTPGNSTFTGPANIDAPEMDVLLCGFFHSMNCVPQPGVNERLDPLSEFTMYRAVYRNFGTHESLWVNNTVNLGDQRAGIRWAEIRNPGGAPTLYQTGTHGPDDGVHRWMGSLAVDKKGNMALGYSASGTSLYPSIRYVGRLGSDPLGSLSQGESEMYAGTGSQTASFGRWGDYSSMSMDESDDCTFWYTTEYYETTGSFDFKTRIGSFRFPTCVADATGFLRGTVTDAVSGNPIPGAQVSAGAFSAITLGTGNYSIEVPSGTYDVTVSAYGYASQTLTGVVIGDGATVDQDFAIVAQKTVQVSGTVVDGSGANWPLYAKVRIAPLSGPVQTVYTNSNTGQYQVTVFANSTYDFAVSAVVSGYLAQDRRVAVGPADQNESFTLLVDGAACSAPGYGFVGTTLASADFESGLPAGWTVTNTTTGCPVPEWTDTDPSDRGNLTGGSGKFMVADADNCGSEFADMNTDLISPTLDLSGVGAGNALRVSFNSDYEDLCDRAIDKVSLDVWNGSSWVTIVNFCNADRHGPRLESFFTTAANGVPNARVRWHYVADWDWWWQVDNVTVTASSCQFGGGGRVTGSVYDANTGTPLNGAVITLDSGGTTTTEATPTDPTVDDGHYVLYPPSGTRTLAASFGVYQGQSRTFQVTGGSVTKQDFQLAAGRLVALPLELRQRLGIGGAAVANLSLGNTGGVAAAFSVLEIDAPIPGPVALKPSTTPKLPKGPKTVSTTNPPVNPSDLPIAPRAGDFVGSFDTGLAGAWGIGFDTDHGDLWISDVDQDGDVDYRFTTAGVNTGDTIDTDLTFPADMTFNSRTGMLWQVDSVDEGCLYEMNPVTRTVTGNKICPDFSEFSDPSSPLRGLAYNAVTDTYYVGTFVFANFVAEVDGKGNVLRSKTVGLRIQGLAVNPRTGHLFAQVFDSLTFIWVLDVNDDFNIKSAFALSGPNGPAYAAAAGAGLEMDCAGKLWSVNRINRKVFINDSGETDTCVKGIPWLRLSPESGSVAPAGRADITASFTTAGIPTGCHEGHVVAATDTPYREITVPAGITVQFSDVPSTVKGDRYIHALAAAEIVRGCTTEKFCPTRPLARSVAAQWLLRSRFGADYAPPPAHGIFADVSPESPVAAWAEDLYNRGIIAACGANPLRFCRYRSITKREMAGLLLKTLEGPTYTPPACAGLFSDVPCTTPDAPWIEDAFNRGFLGACSAPGRFCPRTVMTRAQSAEADAKAFGIPACKQ